MRSPDYRRGFWERLSALGFESYGEYLASAHWKDVRRRWCQTGMPQRCSVCRSKRFQLHHKTYERLGAEQLDDLVALCRHCHDKTHKVEARGKSLESSHESVKAVVLREEQYQQDRDRARTKALQLKKPKRRRKARASEITRTRKTRKLA